MGFAEAMARGWARSQLPTPAPSFNDVQMCSPLTTTPAAAAMDKESLSPPSKEGSDGLFGPTGSPPSSPVKAMDDALWEQASGAVFKKGSTPPRDPARKLDLASSEHTRPICRLNVDLSGSAPPLAASTKPVQILAHELSLATGGFNPKYCIGAGGFGHVFKASVASLRAAGLCAIKRLPSGSSVDGVSEEIELLSRCRHPNVLPLLGYCLRPTACVVYPLMGARRAPRQ